MANALAATKRFPGLLPMFARLGEQTGTLPQMLQRAAAQLSMEVQRRALALATLLEPQDQTTFLPGTPDKDFDRLLMTWLMGIICGALCLEWLFRRLNKLA